MTRPASVKFRVAKSKGRAIPPGRSMAEVDWDKAEEVLSGQHRPDDFYIGSATGIAEQELRVLEEEGNDSKARRVRADINTFRNATMALRASWCPTCLNFLHNCQCDAPEADSPSVEFVDYLTSQLGPRLVDKEERKAKKKQDARDKRKAKKLDLGGRI